MKNFKKITFRKGARGLLSTTGQYGFWYPDLENKVTIQKEISAEHMHLWKNQDPYFAFRVAPCALNKRGDKDICVWFHEKSILIEKGLISNSSKK